jgi:hypothetical protein
MTTHPSQPSKSLAYGAVITGVLLLIAGSGAAIGYLGLPFALFGQDVLGSQMGTMAAMFLGLICGALAVWHGISSIRNRASRPLKLPPMYILWIVFALVLGIGNVILNFRIAQMFLFPPLFLLGAALPTLSVVAWSVHRLGAPITWRQAALALVAGSTLSIFVALGLEILLPLLAFWLVLPLQLLVYSFDDVLLSSGTDFLTRLFLSPLVIVILILTALEAPLPEEFSKALSASLFGRQRIVNERQAFAIGLVCGAGFAILENMMYEGLYAQRHDWSWGGITLLRGVGAVLHPVCCGLVTLGWFRARAGGWGKLLAAYFAAVGLHTLWNGGFTALVFLTGIQYYKKSAVLSLYGMSTQIVLLAFLIALSLGLWWILRVLIARLAQGIEPDRAPMIVSNRAIAIWACACAFVMALLGAALGPAWSQIRQVILP